MQVVINSNNEIAIRKSDDLIYTYHDFRLYYAGISIPGSTQTRGVGYVTMNGDIGSFTSISNTGGIGYKFPNFYLTGTALTGFLLKSNKSLSFTKIVDEDDLGYIIEIFDNEMFVGSRNGLYKYVDEIEVFKNFNLTEWISAIEKDDTGIYVGGNMPIAGVNKGLYKLNDNGDILWNQTYTIPPHNTLEVYTINKIKKIGSELLCLIDFKTDQSGTSTPKFVKVNPNTGDLIEIVDLNNNFKIFEIDDYGNIYAAGLWSSVSGERPQLAKYDSNFNLIWSINNLHVSYQILNLLIDPHGNIWISGRASDGYPDIYKFTPNGVKMLEIDLNYGTYKIENMILV